KGNVSVANQISPPNHPASHQSISPMMKLRAISKIAKPLPWPSSSSASRGAIIAVEGDNARSVDALTTALKLNLTGVGSDKIHVLSSNELDDSNDNTEESDEGMAMARYMRVVADWRAKTTWLRRLVTG